MENDKLVSLLYSVVTPVLNPIIYSLRNKDVKEALCSITRTGLLSQRSVGPKPMEHTRTTDAAALQPKGRTSTPLPCGGHPPSPTPNPNGEHAPLAQLHKLYQAGSGRYGSELAVLPYLRSIGGGEVTPHCCLDLFCLDLHHFLFVQVYAYQSLFTSMHPSAFTSMIFMGRSFQKWNKFNILCVQLPFQVSFNEPATFYFLLCICKC